MWIPNESFKTTKRAESMFKNSLSTSYLQTDQNYEIKYGIGYVEGFLASDQVSLVSNPSNSEIAHQVEMLSVYQA